MFGKGYGMPSSHAQFVAFFAIYLSLFLVFRHTFTYSTSRVVSNFTVRVVLAFILCLGAASVALSRIYLNYHTPKQVMVGWFLRSHGWIDWTLELSVARFMRIRDLVVSEDLAEAGWQRWNMRRRLNASGDSNTSPSRKSD
ncbi:hypothetical protein LTS12_028304 [Elasticomyces elasticus]|nr:hypothetical protein LTS12_028304 [Elasticomyces elasticus]